jgi:hypothetical protein
LGLLILPLEKGFQLALKSCGSPYLIDGTVVKAQLAAAVAGTTPVRDPTINPLKYQLLIAKIHAESLKIR